MRDLLRSFISRAAAEPTSAEEPAADARLRVAACALLLEVAHADASFTEVERRHVEESLARHFDLAPGAVDELIGLAERARREATGLFEFTSLINESYDEGQRMVLVELLWRVVLADGDLSRHEGPLMRRIASLLDLRPGYLAEARRRVVPPRAADPEPPERGAG